MRRQVQSSFINALDYDRESLDLEIEFSNGNKVNYTDVPEEVFAAFLSAPSKGGFYHKVIKPYYKQGERKPEAFKSTEVNEGNAQCPNCGIEAEACPVPLDDVRFQQFGKAVTEQTGLSDPVDIFKFFLHRDGGGVIVCKNCKARYFVPAYRLKIKVDT